MSKTVPAPRVDYNGEALVASHGAHKPVRIVLHDTEGHDVGGIADLEGLATFWHSQGRGFGSHIATDAEGFSGRYCNDRQIAYHVAKRNTGSLGIEQIGFASFTTAEWMKRPKQLDET